MRVPPHPVAADAVGLLVGGDVVAGVGERLDGGDAGGAGADHAGGGEGAHRPHPSPKVTPVSPFPRWHDPAMAEDDLRASDAEREQLVDALRDHAAEGRLTTDELEERTAAAYSATTRGELVALRRDLPETAPPAGIASRGGRRADRRRARQHPPGRPLARAGAAGGQGGARRLQARPAPGRRPRRGDDRGQGPPRRRDDLRPRRRARGADGPRHPRGQEGPRGARAPAAAARSSACTPTSSSATSRSTWRPPASGCGTCSAAGASRGASRAAWPCRSRSCRPP